jgi:hypothetical protein
MSLTDAQKQQVAAWIREGAKLSEIQSRLSAEFGVRLTYMEVRLLVDDLKLTPKDQERERPIELGATAGSAAGAASRATPAAAAQDQAPASQGRVTVKVDEITRPGAVVSGRVSFSDGQQAEWYLDQFGRLSLAAAERGYKPSAADLQSFQLALENELAKLGF